LHTHRLYIHMPDFEGMMWKEMVVMGEQAIKVQSRGARRKMLKTFEVTWREMGIDDPMAPPLLGLSGGLLKNCIVCS
ncbi:hypothetical protein EI94DRAFT_1622018, partial [Lactarius quietus]